MTGQYWDETLNVVIGCDRVSDGCDYCFAPPAAWIRKSNPNDAVAAAFAGVVKKDQDGLQWTGRVNELPARLETPFRRVKPRTFYLTLLGDLFHAKVSDDFIARTFAVAAVTGRHTYLSTTKRHGRMRSLLNNRGFHDKVAEYAVERAGQRGAQLWDGVWPLPNVRLSVSVEDQTTAGLRIPALMETPAAVRWVSAEPLLGGIRLCRCDGAAYQVKAHPFLVHDKCPLHGAVRLDWLVTGGESGSKRAVHPDHVRQLRDQCVATGVPFWFKQWGDYRPFDVVDRPGMVGGRGYQNGGWASPIIREPGPTGTMRTATTRLLEPGERTRGTVMMDENTIAVRMGAKAAGRELDGRTWDQLP